jgi:hypothetical protein
MYPCCCILFTLLIGFYPKAKRFKNHLKIQLKSGLEKEKGKIPFLPLSLDSAYRPIPLSGPHATPFPLSPSTSQGPAQHRISLPFFSYLGRPKSKQ